MRGLDAQRWRRFWLLVALAMLAGGAVPFAALAAPPWQNLMTVNRVEADPSKKYDLGERNGPWLILAVTFAGDGAEQQARELCLELRKRYKLPAYVHPMDVDLTDAPSRGYDQYGKALKMKYQRDEELREIAVMVGDYPTVDDPQAQADLKKLKFMKPECLELKEGRKVSRPLAALRYMQQQIESGFIDDKKSAVVENVKAGRGAMANAFVTTNPLLPREYFVPDGLDSEIVELNKGLKFSLLDCKKKYTVKVATFTGSVVIDPRKIQEIEKEGGEMPSKLAQAAEDAHGLTEVLRAKGYEAYEFHDRNSSLVCVGGFESIGNRLPDGRLDPNPAVLKIIETFGGKKSVLPGQTVPQVTEPKTQKVGKRSVPFDLQPVPVEVPRQSLSRQYEHTVAERF